MRIEPRRLRQAQVVQRAKNLGDTRALHSQHHPEEFVRKRKLVRADPIAGHQQPTATALLHRMQHVTDDRIRNLRAKGGLIEPQQLAERTVPCGDLSLKHIRFHPMGIARDLNHDFVGRRPLSLQDAQADHPFPADRCHFNGTAVPHRRQSRDDHSVRKVHAFNRSSGGVEDLFGIQSDGLHESVQPFGFGIRQARQKLIDDVGVDRH